MLVRRKRGDIDPETGLLFWQYSPGSKNGEYWVTPERFREKQSLVRASNAFWAEANRDRIKESNRAKYPLVRESRLAAQGKWRDANRAEKRRLDREWKKRNPDKIVARDHRRRGLRLGRLHPNHDMSLERSLQVAKRRISRCLGIAHHLDHILPLDAGGWHHHTNLQVIPAVWNLRKNADPRFPLPDCYVNNAPIPPAINTGEIAIIRK